MLKWLTSENLSSTKVTIFSQTELLFEFDILQGFPLTRDLLDRPQICHRADIRLSILVWSSAIYKYHTIHEWSSFIFFKLLLWCSSLLCRPLFIPKACRKVPRWCHIIYAAIVTAFQKINVSIVSLFSNQPDRLCNYKSVMRQVTQHAYNFVRYLY